MNALQLHDVFYDTTPGITKEAHYLTSYYTWVLVSSRRHKDSNAHQQSPLGVHQSIMKACERLSLVSALSVLKCFVTAG